MNAKLRETHALNVRLAIIAREKREAARRAAARRAREKASRKKAAVNPLQALWDANGAAIYAANQAFKTKYGRNMSAKVRRKAIKDATRNGHFNAGAYAGNLVVRELERQVQATNSGGGGKPLYSPAPQGGGDEWPSEVDKPWVHNPPWNMNGSSTDSPMPTAAPVSTATPTSSCPACPNQYAEMLYGAIMNNKNDLPPGFSESLLFAMATVETGGLNPAYQNSPTHGGVFQLRKESGHYHPDFYTNTPEGYDQNVIDAIAVINKSYLDAKSTKDNLPWKLDLYDKFPNNQEEATAARAVLYYNAGFGWWLPGPGNPYSYVNKPENKPYVGNVAVMLTSYVPKAFGVSSDPSLVSVLERVQLIVNVVVK